MVAAPVEVRFAVARGVIRIAADRLRAQVCARGTRQVFTRDASQVATISIVLIFLVAWVKVLVEPADFGDDPSFDGTQWHTFSVLPWLIILAISPSIRNCPPMFAPFMFALFPFQCPLFWSKQTQYCPDQYPMNK